MTTGDQYEKIILVALLEGVWPKNPFLSKLARKTPMTLLEFIDRANNIVNVVDMLKAMTDFRNREVKVL